MMNKYKFEIVTLSETWLKINKTQLKHVQIDGYESKFKIKVKIERGTWFLY